MFLADTATNLSAGKKSFHDLKRVDDVEYDIYIDACGPLCLLQDDPAWIDLMEDASQQDLPQKLRTIFIILMCFTDLTEPKAIFKLFNDRMSEDCNYKLMPPDNPNLQLVKTILLIDLEGALYSATRGELFPVLGYRIIDQQRVKVARAQREYYHHHQCREVGDEIPYDQETMCDALNVALHGQGPSLSGKFTESQNEVYEAVQHAIGGSSKHIMIDARGGTGKTFLIKRLLHYVRTVPGGYSIALAVGSSGIACQL